MRLLHCLLLSISSFLLLYPHFFSSNALPMKYLHLWKIILFLQGPGPRSSLYSLNQYYSLCLLFPRGTAPLLMALLTLSGSQSSVLHGKRVQSTFVKLSWAYIYHIVTPAYTFPCFQINNALNLTHKTVECFCEKNFTHIETEHRPPKIKGKRKSLNPNIKYC